MTQDSSPISSDTRAVLVPLFRALSGALDQGGAGPSRSFAGASCVTARGPFHLAGGPALFAAMEAVDAALRSSGLVRHQPGAPFAAGEYAVESGIRIHGGGADIESLTLCVQGDSRSLKAAVDAAAGILLSPSAP